MLTEKEKIRLARLADDEKQARDFLDALKKAGLVSLNGVMVDASISSLYRLINEATVKVPLSMKERT